MKHKLFGIPVFALIIGVVAVVAAGGLVIGAVVLTQHNSVNIVYSGGGGGGGLTPATLTTYSDAACTVPLADPLDWSNVNVGGLVSKTYYVKNTGQVAAGPVTITAPAVAWGTVTVATTPATVSELAAGASFQVDVSVSVNTNATPQTGATFAVGFSY